MKHFACILNEGSGSAPSEKEVSEVFDAAGARVECLDIKRGKSALLADLKKSNYDALVAAGGDGTVNMAGELALQLDLPLGILPVGTLNHFAKDLGLPLELEAAAQTVCSGRQQATDYCTVNDKVFVNNASIGIYPSIVLDRESKNYINKWLATATAFMAALFKDHTLRAEITAAGTTTGLTSPLIFIGNNSYELEKIGFTKRSSITSGEIFLYVVKATRVRSLILLAFLSLFGMRRRQADMLKLTTGPITIASAQKSVNVAIDGEVLRFDFPLNFAVYIGLGLSVDKDCIYTGFNKGAVNNLAKQLRIVLERLPLYVNPKVRRTRFGAF